MFTFMFVDHIGLLQVGLSVWNGQENHPSLSGPLQWSAVIVVEKTELTLYYTTMTLHRAFSNNDLAIAILVTADL